MFFLFFFNCFHLFPFILYPHNKHSHWTRNNCFDEVKRLLALSDDDYYDELAKALNLKYSFILIKNKRIKNKSVFRKENRLVKGSK